MNKAEKVQHLRNLADALEEGRDILDSHGNSIGVDEDGIPKLNLLNIWGYKPKPKPFECWVTVYGELGITTFRDSETAAKQLCPSGKTFHMRAVEE